MFKATEKVEYFKCPEIKFKKITICLAGLQVYTPGFPKFSFILFVTIFFNFVGTYGNNLDCYWFFLTTANASISFNFYQVDIERSDECLADYISLLDGPTVYNKGKFTNQS